MAMINCPDCSKEVSDTALKCPSCGVQLRKAKRTIIGKVFLWVFILFNVIMVAWLWGGMSAATEVVQEAGSDLEAAGSAIGAGIGGFMIVLIWVLGDIILGLPVLFTRPKS